MTVKNQEALAGLSLVTLAAVWNSAVENHSLPAKPVKKYASKAVGIEHIVKSCEEFGLEIWLIDEGEVALVRPGQQGSPAPSVEDGTVRELSDGSPADEARLEEQGDEPAGDEPANDEPANDEPKPFVKLAKDQLPARGTPEREAYRKARRAAARAARKAAAE